jgi:5-methylcytosine-specific restriction endonuclease McrA
MSMMRRTYNIYRHQAARAAEAGRFLPYTLNDIRAAAEQHTNCHYCRCDLTHANISLDHRLPVSRGGAWTLTNMVVCCERCNQTKGSLTEDEFHALRNLLMHLGNHAYNDVMKRLRAGARRAFGRRKP